MSAIRLCFITYFLLSSCATTPKEKIIQHILIGTAIGFIAGQSRDQNKLANGIMFAGAAGTASGLASVYYSDLDTESKRIKEENQKMKVELEKAFSPELVHQTSGMMNSKIPDKYKSMINPGEWKVYSLDQWIEDGENRLIHQDKMMELIPPTLRPAILPTTTQKGD